MEDDRVKSQGQNALPDNEREILRNLAITKLMFLKGEAKQQVGRKMLKACRKTHTEEQEMLGVTRNKPFCL